MTFVGKVLIFAQVVLSVCFMAFAGAVVTVQTNWKNEAKEQADQLKSAKIDVAELIKSIDNLTMKNEAEIDDANKLRDLAIAARDVAQRKADTFEDGRTEARKERNEYKTLARLAGDESKMRRAEAIRQRGVNEKLHQQMDNIASLVTSLQDQLFDEEQTNKTVSVKHKRLLDVYAQLKKAARLAGYPTDPAVIAGIGAPPPDVEGLVLTARKGRQRGDEFVEISLGSDDGLLEGHTLFVFRTAERNNGRGKFLGKIEIVRVFPDRAVGTVVLPVKNGIIKKGDNVSTRL